MTTKKYDERHGGAWDRGSADSYYGRPRDPHYWPFGTYVEAYGRGKSTRVEAAQMSADELEAYNAGYDENEKSGNKKQW